MGGRWIGYVGSCMQVPGVVLIDRVSGPYELIARVEADTAKDLGRLVGSRMQICDGITRTQTCPIIPV